MRALAAALGVGLAAPITASAAASGAGGTASGLLLALAVLCGAGAALAGVACAHWLQRRRERAAAVVALASTRHVLACSADLLWHCDAAGRLRTVEQIGSRLPAGAADPMALSALISRPLWHWSAGEPPPCPPLLQQTLAARAPIVDLVVMLDAGGSAQPWLISGQPDGDGYVGTARCLAEVAVRLGEHSGSAQQAEEIERLRTEAAERSRQHEIATRELESFAHSVSHDLRAPLRVVDGFATILQEDYAQPGKALDDLGAEHIRRIIGAGQRMNAMIDTLLTMSRMTSRDLERERVNLSHLARELADELKAADRSRRVEFAIAPDLVVDGDRTLLRLVLQNLIGNAFKFTGRVAIGRIEVGAATDSDGRRVFHVCDNGAGFDPRFAEKMFGLFQRFHSANEFPGTGVGLATVQRIVRKHGGRIWAESTPGEGARFYFTLWEH